MPRAFPGKYGVMVHCLDSGTVDEMVIEEFDGVNYEASLKAANEQKQ